MTTEKEQLEAEIVKRDARIAGLEVQQEVLESHLADAGDWDQKQIAVIHGFHDEIAALKAQQPSAGVACALMSALEGIVHDQRVPNEVSQECAAVLIEARRLNPCRVQAVPDGYVLVPVEPTPAMILAYNVHGTEAECPLRRGPPRNLNVGAYKDMIAAAPSASADARLGVLLKRIVEHLEYDAIGSPSEAIAGDLAKELRAMLARSESEG